MQDKELITVKEARKLLGKSGSGLTDSQIQEIVDNLTIFARSYLSKRNPVQLQLKLNSGSHYGSKN